MLAQRQCQALVEIVVGTDAVRYGGGAGQQDVAGYFTDHDSLQVQSHQ